MTLVLANNWWSLLLRGLLALLLGVLTLAWPGITVGALVLLFGAYAFLDGVMSIVGAVTASRGHQRWALLVAEGVVGILAAIATFAWPAITLLMLIYVIASWSIVTGVLEIMAAVRLRKSISGELFLALAGAASILFGIMLMSFPVAGALVIGIWVGVYALIFGAMLIGLGLRLRNWTRSSLGPAALGIP